MEAFSGSTIDNQHGTVITTMQIYGNSSEKGVGILLEYIVKSAMHTSSAHSELGCHRDTRSRIIDDIISSVEAVYRNRAQNIRWLLGPAGIGKSAIAKAVADRLESQDSGSDARVAASFFFCLGDTQRNNLYRFVPTLAYQLALAFENVGRKIRGILERDRTVLQESLVMQWKKLIVDPLMQAPDVPPAVIIIDGLDECQGVENQAAILNLVSEHTPHNFPTSLISSRPEPDIANHFRAEPLQSRCLPFIDLATLKDHEEMRFFIRSTFSKIHTQYSDILSDDDDESWPSDKQIDEIVFRADGQFLYPITLFRYISGSGIEKQVDPFQRLEACLQRDPQALLSPLDALYSFIQLMDICQEL
ncbi:hypothetical protein AX16_005276 [Volvariella volvacea WC 439]|nr:hypothetical protein AX16_005276 [Volvariella volvacea WC 439]